MANPVLVEVTRGDLVESRHRGAIAVFDADGAVVTAVGDVDAPVFPRSAVKAIQALPLVESGAADALGFGDRELALACASHSGEVAHAALAASMLAKVGLDDQALECGAHWPFSDDASRRLARDGETPSQLHNNCSGKHAGFICACCHEGLPSKGYVGFGHAWQLRLRETMSEVTGVAHDEANAAIDGCSIPTHAVPLRALAAGFARMATGVGLGPARAAAASRLLTACMKEPFYVSGTGRMDAQLMEAGNGRIFVKTGAEAVYCAAVPEFGVGIAIKCDDGGTRASETIVASVLSRLLHKDDQLARRLDELARPGVPTRRGAVVGQVRPAGELAR